MQMFSKDGGNMSP